MEINWYRCTDDPTADCGGDTNTMVADETDTAPAFSVYFDATYDWCWTAWNNDALSNLAQDEGFVSQAAAMHAAERWLATYTPPGS